MCIRFLLFLIVLFALGVSGCMEQSTEVTLSKPPPTRPMEVSYVPEIAEPNGVITLRESLAMALLRNPELAAFSWEIRAAQARRLQAGLLPNPQLGVTVEEFGGSKARRDFDTAQTTIQLGQLIELAGKRPKRTRLAELERELSQWDYESRRLDVMVQVAGAFIDVLAAQEQLALTEELVGVSEQVSTVVSQRVKAGKDSPLEQIKAEVQLSIIQIEWQRAKRILVSARKQLAATWGSKSPAFDKAVGQFDTVLPIPSSAELADKVSQNPDVARWVVEIKQRRAALELEKARAIMDPTVFGGGQHFNDTDETGFIVGVSIALPVFNWNQGRVLEAGHRLSKARAERKAVETNVYAALSEAYQRLSSAFVEATALESNVLPGAQSAFDAARLGYREGKFDFLSVLDAQRTLFEARGQYIVSLAAYHSARADVERLIGRSIDSKTLSKSEDLK